jgi:hypothetical protein
VCLWYKNAPPCILASTASSEWQPVSDILETLDNGPMPISDQLDLTDLGGIVGGAPLTLYVNANMKRICIECEHNLKRSHYFFKGNIYTIFYFVCKMFLTGKGKFFEFLCTLFNTAAYSVLLHRFHCARGCWD